MPNLKAITVILLLAPVFINLSMAIQPEVPAADPPAVGPGPAVELLVDAVEREIADEQWLQGVRTFQEAWAALSRTEDVIRRHQGNPGDQESSGGLRSRMRSVFRSAPEDFRVEYQRQCDGVARTALSLALQERQFERFRELLFEHEFCDACESGLRILAVWNLQLGNFFDAALTLKSLNDRTEKPLPSDTLLLAQTWARSGLIAEARQTVGQLADQIGYGTSVSLDGRTVQLPESSEKIAGWVASQWPSVHDETSGWYLPGGDPRRLRQHSVIPPRLMAKWNRSRFQSTVRSQFNAPLRALASRMDATMATVPFGREEALLVGDRIIYMAVGSLQCVHRDTGELLWESTLFNRQLNSVLGDLDEQDSAYLTPSAQVLQLSALNHVRGQLTTDGRTVFAIEETSQGDASLADTASNPAIQVQQYNVLRAYDVVTGRLQAQAGGAAIQMDPDHQDPLMGLYFLGAPLLLNQRILVMAEDSQGIHLLNLRLQESSRGPGDEQTFEIVDRQLVFVPEAGFDGSIHPNRRYAGITPSFAGGLIICQGCDGYVAAVMATDLSIVWRQQYHTNVRIEDLGHGAPAVAGAKDGNQSLMNDLFRRPHDSLARVVGSSVLVMPRDSDQVICLDSGTGEFRWAKPRGRIRYFGAVTDDLAVLTGGAEILAVRVDNGSILWNQELDSDSVSGQPVWTDRITQVPTRSGRIITIENATGRRLLQERVSEAPVGNLLSVQDYVFIQSHTQLACWKRSDSPVNERLAAASIGLLTQNPDSMIADLESLIDDGSIDQDTRHDARRMLADLLLESLRLDYNGTRHRIPRLRELTTNSTFSASQVAALVRRTLGMTLVDAVQLPSFLEQIEESRSRQDQLERLIVRGLPQQTDLPPDEIAEQISSVVVSVLRHEPREMDNGRIRTLSSVIAAGAIAQTLEKLDEAKREHVVSSLTGTVVQELESNTLPGQRLSNLRFCWTAGLGQSVAQAKEVFALPAGRSEDSFASLQILVSLAADLPESQELWTRLAAHWTAVVKSDSPSTVDSWPSPDQYREQSNVSRNDPVGILAELQREIASDQDLLPGLVRPAHVVASPARDGIPGRNPSLGSAERLIPIYGAPGAFRDWKLMTLHGESRLMAIDQRGNKAWEFEPSQKPNEPVNQVRNYDGSDENYAVACGFLLAVRHNQSLFMLDCSGTTGGSPQVLWSLSPGQIMAPASPVQRFLRGWERTTMYDRQPDGLAPVGPLTEYGLPLYQGRRLTVVDPWTGRPRWTVEDLPDDCRLLADGKTLCLVSSAEGLIQVRDMRDGQLRESHAIPAWWSDANELYDTSVRQIESEAGTELPWRVAIDGTCCVVFRMGHDKCELTSHDLANPDAETQIAWNVTLPANSVFSNVSDGMVAVLSNDSELRLIRVFDGNVLATHEIAEAPNCDRLYLRKSHGKLIVLTHCDDYSQGDAPVIDQSVPVNGPIVALDARDLSLAWKSESNHEFIRINNPDRGPIPEAAPLLVLLKATIRTPEGNRAMVRELSVRIFDVQTGDVLHEDDNPGRGLSYHGIRFSGDRRFTVVFDRRDVDFSFAGTAKSEDEAELPDEADEDVPPVEP